MPARREVTPGDPSLVEDALRRRLALPTFDPTAMRLLYLDLARAQPGISSELCGILAFMATAITDHAKEVEFGYRVDFFKEQAKF